MGIERVIPDLIFLIYEIRKIKGIKTRLAVNGANKLDYDKKVGETEK